MYIQCKFKNYYPLTFIIPFSFIFISSFYSLNFISVEKGEVLRTVSTVPILGNFHPTDSSEEGPSVTISTVATSIQPTLPQAFMPTLPQAFSQRCHKHLCPRCVNQNAFDLWLASKSVKIKRHYNANLHDLVDSLKFKLHSCLTVQLRANQIKHDAKYS